MCPCRPDLSRFVRFVPDRRIVFHLTRKRPVCPRPPPTAVRDRRLSPHPPCRNFRNWHPSPRQIERQRIENGLLKKVLLLPKNR